MATYRTNRNIEKSILDYLQAQVASDWSNIRVEKTWANVKNGELPAVCVRIRDTSHERTGIGNTSTRRSCQVLIDIFATSDGQKLDLEDYIVEKLKAGCTYYTYVTARSGNTTVVDSKTENGRVRVFDIEVSPLDFDTDSVYDRYRSLITLEVRTSKVED